MSVRFRKSINLGGGFRINVSKSGVGYSWGTRGFRYTRMADGRTRSTYSIPGTGISYVEESGLDRQKVGNGDSNVNQLHSQILDNVVSTETVDVNEFHPAEYEELLASIKKVINLNTLSTVLIVTFLFSVIPFFIITGVVGVLLKIYVHTKMPVIMEYLFDNESQKTYDNLSNIWMSLNRNSKFWQTISESVINRKRNGGASRGVNRIITRAINKTPFFIKSNVQPFGLQLRRQTLYFLPDKLLIISGRGVGAINYSDIHMRFSTTRFVETESAPKDANVVGTTWLKVNKDGSPDKRFKENRQVPVCEYGEILIESGSALHVELMCSNSATISDMRGYAEKIFDK